MSCSSLAPLDDEAPTASREEVDQYANAMVRRLVDFWDDLAADFDKIDQRATAEKREMERHQ